MSESQRPFYLSPLALYNIFSNHDDPLNKNQSRNPSRNKFYQSNQSVNKNYGASSDAPTPIHVNKREILH